MIQNWFAIAMTNNCNRLESKDNKLIRNHSLRTLFSI